MIYHWVYKAQTSPEWTLLPSCLTALWVLIDKQTIFPLNAVDWFLVHATAHWIIDIFCCTEHMILCVQLDASILCLHFLYMSFCGMQLGLLGLWEHVCWFILKFHALHFCKQWRLLIKIITFYLHTNSFDMQENDVKGQNRALMSKAWEK